MPVSVDYAAPTSLDDAIGRLGTRGDACVLAGGQGLLTELKAGRVSPALLVDLRNLPDLAGIGPTADGRFRCGAMTTIDALASSEPLRGGGGSSALADCIRQFGDPQVRNRATVGGGLVNAHPGVDLPAVALAVGATIHTAGPGGRRAIDADDLFGRSPAPVLQPGEIATAVDWPLAAAGSGTASAYQKVRNPASGYALCGAAVSIAVDPDGMIGACRVALAGTAERAVRLPKVEAALVGRAATTEGFAGAASHVAEEGLHFLDDVAAPADYRCHLAEILVARALTLAAQRARKVNV